MLWWGWVGWVQPSPAQRSCPPRSVVPTRMAEEYDDFSDVTMEQLPAPIQDAIRIRTNRAVAKGRGAFVLPHPLSCLPCDKVQRRWASLAYGPPSEMIAHPVWDLHTFFLSFYFIFFGIYFLFIFIELDSFILILFLVFFYFLQFSSMILLSSLMRPVWNDPSSSKANSQERLSIRWRLKGRPRRRVRCVLRGVQPVPVPEPLLPHGSPVVLC